MINTFGRFESTLRKMETMEAGSSNSNSSKFKVGDTVSILRHGKAVITSDSVEDPQHERFGRYQVSTDTSSEAVSSGRLTCQPVLAAEMLTFAHSMNNR
jgi:ABC-type uncharacterized transport system ATPase subunit